MSSDGESINNAVEVSDNDQNEVLEIGEDLQQEEQTELVQRDETAGGDGDGDNADGETRIVKPKRVVRNPQPKLNEETLKGPRGIAALESYFERVKFKGKGREQQDLDVIMKTYEYWCHRLFPKFPFETCIERLEKLGTKRAVQTHIKRIRFDLLVEDRPIIDSSDEEPNVEGFVDIQNDEINQQQNQQFDQLLGSANIPTPVELSEEQLERIRLNKERAERLKQERLRKIRDKAEGSLQVSSQLPGTSGVQNDIRLGPSEAVESTESDIFTQEEYIEALEREENAQNVLDEVENTEILFDHESNVKGKKNVIGASVKKKSSKRRVVFDDSDNSDYDNIYSNIPNKDELSNKEALSSSKVLDVEHNSPHGMGSSVKRKSSKRTIVSDDSDNSDDDNMGGNIQNKDDFSNKEASSNTQLLDTDQNSSDYDFAAKRKNKQNTIYDSDDRGDDQSIDDNNDQQHKISKSEHLKVTADDNLNVENSVATHISHRKPHNLLDSDESDQELEEDNQFPKQINTVSDTKKNSYAISNHSVQDMDTDQVQLCDINKVNGICPDNENYQN